MLSGIYPIVPTPFDERGRIDGASIASLAQFMVDCGVDGLAILGVMGEADKLSGREREEVIRLFRAALPTDRPLVVGTGAAGTDVAIEMSRVARALGANALLVGPPPVQNDHALFGYYQRVAGALDDTPIIVHDYPTATGILMAPEVLARMHREIANVRYVKLEDAPTGPKMAQVQTLAGRDFHIFGALGGMFALEELERGAVGIMTGLAYPELLVELYRRFRAGDLEQARELFYAMLPLVRFEFQPKLGVSLRKEILVRRGAIRCATVRHPGMSADSVTLGQLDRIVAYLSERGILSVNALA
jgi:4-hydroxy-tetrahydrodipicolinate synthase